MRRTRTLAMAALLGLTGCTLNATLANANPPAPQLKPFFEGTLDILDAPEVAALSREDIAERLGIRLPITKPAQPASVPDFIEPNTAVTRTSAPTRTASRPTQASRTSGRVPTWARTQNPSACMQALRDLGADFSPIEQINGRMGCRVENAVELRSIGGARLRPAAKLNCAMALRVARWGNDAQGIAATVMGDRIETFHHMSAYSCRRRGSGKLSEHAFGNAFDLGGVTLANSGRTTVLKDWYNDGTLGSGALSSLWRGLARRGCERFQLVLSPVSDAAHRNHLHFDLGRWAKCDI